MEAQLTQVGLPLLGIPGMSVFTGYLQDPIGKIPIVTQLVGARFREDILIAAVKRLRPDPKSRSLNHEEPASTVSGEITLAKNKKRALFVTDFFLVTLREILDS